MADDCKKRGPYLPIGEDEWVCDTHNAALVWDSSLGVQSKASMICPQGRAGRIIASDERERLIGELLALKDRCYDTPISAKTTIDWIVEQLTTRR